MLFGMDGVEIGLIVVFMCLFAGIMSGYPVAFAIGGSAIISFAILGGLGELGWLVHEVIDTRSDAYLALVNSGISRDSITPFTYPDLPTLTMPLFEHGIVGAINRTLTFIVNRMNERVLAGASIETLLAVAMFVLMGIALERSRIANDLLTTMARVFGPLPGGLAVSVVVVGAFLAASTGIVGATVVTMGLLSLPTMLRNKYSPELATGVISASGTLGQIIPPSIVIVLLGTLAGDIYATAQEERAQSLGCSDALTYLGEAAVLSVGTLFKAAIIPGIFLALLYALYAFGYALWKPEKAPAVHFEEDTGPKTTAQHKLIWLLGVPLTAIALTAAVFSFGLAGGQSLEKYSTADAFVSPELRTNVSERCKAAMIELHGQEKWDRSVATRKELDAARAAAGLSSQANDTVTKSVSEMTAEEVAVLASAVPPLSSSVVVMMLLAGLIFAVTYAVRPGYSPVPLLVGVAGIAGLILADALLVGPLMTAGQAAVIYAIPIFAVLYGLKHAIPRLSEVDLLRVVFPPLVLIIAVLGSILGGITNPTPAAALGAAGAIMLAAHRRLSEEGEHKKARFISLSTLAILVFLMVGVNFDLRTGVEKVGFENWVAIIITAVAYHIAFAGLLYSCWVLWVEKLLAPIVHESAKVTAMVFAILIGSQMLNLVLISFGGEEYIQQFLKSFKEEWVVFLIVMVILFLLGFVLDFLEIIYIVIPIVGPVIYGGTLDPKWVTILIAINLQTSFLTPPFGFALFYLRGVAPPGVTTAQIYRGVIPFVIIQVIALAILWIFPDIVTILPNLFPDL